MLYCIKNEVVTPDGTVLRCRHNWDIQTYIDTITDEWYMIDGLGYYARISNNKTAFKDNSVWIDTEKHYDFDNQEDFYSYTKIRAIDFWGTRGIDGKQAVKYISMLQITTDHLDAILEKQRLSSPIKYLFETEKRYRNWLYFANRSNQ